MFVSTYRVFKFAFENFWRNVWLSLMTISMLVLTLLTVNILLVINRAADQAIKFVENRIEVSVYFQNNADPKKITTAVEYLRSLAQVRDVEEISAEEALAKFRMRHENDPAIISSLEELGGNPFGPTLIIKAKQASDFETIIGALDNPQFRDVIRNKDFSNYQPIVEKIRHTTNNVRMAGLILSFVFFLIALLIIFNTVRIAIFIHREEISIMRLVGASNWFIRAPYLLETVLLSLLAVLIAIAIVYPALLFVEPYYKQYFEMGLADYFEQNGIWIFGAQFLGLLFVTMLSTGLAMRKFLKV